MSLRVTIEPAKRAHARKMWKFVRLRDLEELEASFSIDSKQVLYLSIDLSKEMAWTAKYNGVIVCIFGCCPLGDAAGSPWLIGTDLLMTHEIAFARRCKPYIRQMLEKYSYLHNYVDARNAESIKWLRWLGFTILEAEPYGPFGKPFHRFELCAAQQE